QYCARGTRGPHGGPGDRQRARRPQPAHVLPAPGPGDGRALHPVRAPHLSRVHGQRLGGLPVPRLRTGPHPRRQRTASSPPPPRRRLGPRPPHPPPPPPPPRAVPPPPRLPTNILIGVTPAVSPIHPPVGDSFTSHFELFGQASVTQQGGLEGVAEGQYYRLLT